MFKDVLSSVQDLGLWGSLALVLFFLVFGWWVFSTLMMNDQHVEKMGALPLDNSDEKDN